MTSTMPVSFRHEIDGYLARLRELQSAVWPDEVPRDVHHPFGEVALTEYLRRWAAERPDHPVIVFHDQLTTYAQLDQMSDRVAAFLASSGVQAGDRVAVMMPNVPQFVAVFFGILKAGCVHVPINPMFRRLEICYELEDTGAKMAFILDDFAEEFAAGRQGTAVEAVVATSVREALPADAALPRGAQGDVTPAPGAGRLSNIFADTSLPVPADPMDLDALAALNYTGGTTGMPKGCEHTQRNMLYTAVTGAEHNFGLDGDSVILLYLPVFWIAGEDGFLLTFACGGTCVLQYRWDADTAAEAIDRHGVTEFVGTVDNVLEVMQAAKRAGRSLASIRTAATMSFVTKLSPAIRDKWRRESGSPAVLRESSYGMTEDHTFDTFTRGLDHLDLAGRPGFVGLPMPGTEVAVVDFGSGELVPLGSEGQIIVRSPSMMRGYYGKASATGDALRDGWLHTGDSGVIDEHGCLHYLGRRKEMLKVNGMSVFPSELEFQLSQHPDIVASGVVGEKDEGKGEVPLAFVQLRPGADLAPDDIRSWCRQNMAPYKVPRVRLLEEIPLAPTGKVHKRALEALVREPVTADQT